MTPVHMARYSRRDLRAPPGRATSAVCASRVRATTSRPLVSLSRRWTSPARGTRASFGSSAEQGVLQGVPRRCPRPGARPARPACRARCSARSSIARCQRQALGRHGGVCTGSRASMRTCSPPSTLSLARSGRPVHLRPTPPRSRPCRRAREYCGQRPAPGPGRSAARPPPAPASGHGSGTPRAARRSEGRPGEFAILARFRRREATERPFQMFPSPSGARRRARPVRRALLAVSVSGCHRRDQANLKETPDAALQESAQGDGCLRLQHAPSRPTSG